MAKVQFQVDGLDSNLASIFNDDVTFDGNVDANSISISGTNLFEMLPSGTLPAQTDNSGKYLTTDGTSASWATVEIASKQDVVTNVSSTEIGYLSDVTSSIQEQLDSKLNSLDPVISATIGQTSIREALTLLKPDAHDLVSYYTAVDGFSDGLVIWAELPRFDGFKPILNNISNILDVPSLSNINLRAYSYYSQSANQFTEIFVYIFRLVQNTDENKLALANYVATAPTSMVLFSDTDETIPVIATISSQELAKLDGVSSNIQEQIDAKIGTVTLEQQLEGYATQGLINEVTDNLYVVTGGLETAVNGKQDKVSGVSDTEIGYLNGVTSSIQTQLDSKVDSLEGYATETYVDDSVDAVKLPDQANNEDKYLTTDGTTASWVLPPVMVPFGDGLTAATAARLPSDLERAGHITSGEYWLTGKGTTAYKVYCFYDGGKFWVRTTSLPRTSLLNFNANATTVGTDFSLANTALFNLKINTFGNSVGDDLHVMLRLVGGTFSGATESTPGTRAGGTWQGLPLNACLNGATSVLEVCWPAPSANNGSTNLGHISGSYGNDPADVTWVWSTARRFPTSFEAINSLGWVLHNAGGSEKKANQVFAVINGIYQAGNTSWSRAEIYVRL